MLRHKQEEVNDIDMSVKDGLLKGWVAPCALTSKVGIPNRIWACGSRVKFVHIKYKVLPNLV